MCEGREWFIRVPTLQYLNVGIRMNHSTRAEGAITKGKGILEDSGQGGLGRWEGNTWGLGLEDNVAQSHHPTKTT